MNLYQRFRELSRPLEPEETDTFPKLEKLSGIRSVVYDFYGTLFISGVGDIGIDDGQANAGILLNALQDSGIKCNGPDTGIRGFTIYNKVVEQEMRKLEKNGISFPEPDIRSIWKKVLDRMQAEKLISPPVQNKHCERLSVEFEARMNPVWPMPDTIDTLLYFKTRGMLQGIISNSQFYTPIVLEALAEKSLSELGFDKRLLHWSFEEKMKKPGLPFYEGFLEKIKRADASIQPSDILYIGNDMLKDIWPAATLGMQTALFAGDRRSLKRRQDDQQCRQTEPDLVITELGQLKECVL